MARESKAEGFNVQIVSPDEIFFDGVARSVVAKTQNGYEGFLRDRAACCMLLADDGKVKLAFSSEGEEGEIEKTLNTQGGFLFMDGKLTIYTDKASWEEPKVKQQIHTAQS